MEAIRLVKTAHPDQIEIMNLLSTPLQMPLKMTSPTPGKGFQVYNLLLVNRRFPHLHRVIR